MSRMLASAAHGAVAECIRMNHGACAFGTDSKGRRETRNQGARKYPVSELLDSSAGRGWRGIQAELRSHVPSSAGIAQTTQTEVTIAVAGSADGYVTCRGAGMRQRVVPVDGMIWLVPPGVDDIDIHIARAVPQVLHLFLPTDPFARLAEEHSLPSALDGAIRYTSGVDDTLILQIGLGILQEMRHETPAGDMLAETGAVLLAARLAQRHASGVRARAPERRFRLDPVRLRRVLDYIDVHLNDEITVDELARQCCLSVYHFIRMFSAAVGMPPYRYVAKLRMENAKRLLVQGSLPLCDIAQIACFSNQASFTRAFTRETGMSPGRFRLRSA
jgi:AraC family transcriptional regulator